MQRSNFRLASLTRQIELGIVFSGLPNAINNPLPLIVTEANFFIAKGKYMHYNPSFDLNPCARRVYSGSTFGPVTIDRSLPIDIIFFDGHCAEAIAAKSVPNTARKVSLPETSILDSSTSKSDLYKIGRGHETPRPSPNSP